MIDLLKDPVIIILMVGVALLMGWTIYAGSQVEACFYFKVDFVLCGEGWKMPRSVV